MEGGGREILLRAVVSSGLQIGKQFPFQMQVTSFPTVDVNFYTSVYILYNDTLV